MPLTGCPDSLYTADVIVGKTQIATVALDLGSATLLLPDRSCRSCSNPWGYTINDSLGAELTGVNATFNGTAFTATAEIIFDEVTFPADPPGRSARLPVGIIEAQQGFFRPDRCRLGQFDGSLAPSPSAAGPQGLGAAISFPSSTADNRLYGPPPNSLYRGTFGLGVGPALPASVALFNASWLDVFADLLPAPQIALALCNQNGTLFLGGYPEDNVMQPPVFTALHDSAPYSVTVSSLGLGDDASLLTAQDLGVMRLNTDAPAMQLPARAFARLSQSIIAHSGGLLPADFFSRAACRLLGGISSDALARSLPFLNITLPRAPGRSGTKPRLSLPATGSYLEVIEGQQGQEVGVCPRLSQSEDQDSSFGLSALRNVLLVIDVGAKEAGFAPTLGICVRGSKDTLSRSPKP